MDPIYEAYQGTISEATVKYEDVFDYEVTADDFSARELAELALKSISGLKAWIKRIKKIWKTSVRHHLRKSLINSLMDLILLLKRIRPKSNASTMNLMYGIPLEKS